MDGEIQVTTELDRWVSGMTFHESMPIDALTERVTYRDTIPISDAATLRAVRLKVFEAAGASGP